MGSHLAAHLETENEQNTLRPKLNRLGEISELQQNQISYSMTLLNGKFNIILCHDLVSCDWSTDKNLVMENSFSKPDQTGSDSSQKCLIILYIVCWVIIENES